MLCQGQLSPSSLEVLRRQILFNLFIETPVCFFSGGKQRVKAAVPHAEMFHNTRGLIGETVTCQVSRTELSVLVPLLRW